VSPLPAATPGLAGERAVGDAVECAMNTVLVVELLKGIATPWPRIESDTHIMSAGSARRPDPGRAGLGDETAQHGIPLGQDGGGRLVTAGLAGGRWLAGCRAGGCRAGGCRQVRHGLSLPDPAGRAD